jgi:hypothetical protein
MSYRFNYTMQTKRVRELLAAIGSRGDADEKTVKLAHELAHFLWEGRAEPPKVAEFLLAFLLKPSRADAMIGDLNERFQRDYKDLSCHRARWLYWARTLQSLWPLMRQAAGRALKVGAMIEAARRFF